MNKKDLAGAIIAGGRGTRLNPLSLTIPKALLPICNKPIIFHQIEYMKEIGVKDIYVVVGFLGEQIRSVLGNGSKLGVNIEYVSQKTPEGSGKATGLLENSIKTNFVLFLGDILIKLVNIKEHISKIKEAHANNLNLLACVKEKELERIKQNFEIFLNEDGKVIKVNEKPQNPKTNLKGCGFYLFTPSIFKAINKTPKSLRRNEYELTDAIQLLIDDKTTTVKPLEVIDFDFNISSPEDLYRCNFLWYKDLHVDNLIGEDCTFPGETRILHSIIGNHVTVKHPISIEKSIIFPDSVVDSKNNLSNVLITPNYSIQINPAT